MNIIALEALTFGLGKLVKAAKKNGHTLVLLTHDKRIYEYELSLLRAEDLTVIEVDTFNYDAIENVIKSVGNVIGLLSTTDTWSIHCLEIAKQFGFSSQNSEVIQLVRNKFRLRNKLYSEGLSAGKSLELDPSNFDPSMINSDFCYPCIIKDASGTGSQNVWIAYNKSEVMGILDKASTIALRGKLTIEPFFSGTLFSIETLCWDGDIRILALTSRIMSDEPYFKEEAFSLPIKLSVDKEKKLTEWIEKVLTCVGYDRGFAHTEFMMTENGFEVIEINPRLGGVQIGEALCQIYDENVYEAWIEMALNKRPALMDKPIKAVKGIGQAIIYAQEAGIFSHIEGLERLTSHSGAPFFYRTAFPGQVIDKLDDQRASIGILMAEGESSEIALLNVYAAKNKLKVVMK